MCRVPVSRRSVSERAHLRAGSSSARSRCCMAARYASSARSLLCRPPLDGGDADRPAALSAGRGVVSALLRPTDRWLPDGAASAPSRPSLISRDSCPPPGTAASAPPPLTTRAETAEGGERGEPPPSMLAQLATRSITMPSALCRPRSMPAPRSLPSLLAAVASAAAAAAAAVAVAIAVAARDEARGVVSRLLDGSVAGAGLALADAPV